MTTLKTKLTVLAASVLTLAATAQAQVAMTNNVSVSGYDAASFQKQLGTGTSHLDIDSALIKFTGDYKPVTGVVSLFYNPSLPTVAGGNPSDINLLDAYASWDAGSGWSITAGRFLSWMGYESFFTVNNPEISGGNQIAQIPGYEDGIRLTYTDKDWNAGVALVDSAYNPVTPLKGDAELQKNYGAEAYISYGAIKDNTLWFGLSYDSQNGAAKSQYTFDLYDEYHVSKELTVAGEFQDGRNGLGGPAGYVAGKNVKSWLVLANYAFDDKTSVAFRVSGDDQKSNVSDIKWTIAPTYKITKNFSVRAEISQVNFSGTANKDIDTYGFQTLFQF